MRYLSLLLLVFFGRTGYAQQHHFGIQISVQQRLLATQLRDEALDPTLTATGGMGFGLGSNYLGRLSRRFAINLEANVLFDEERFQSGRFPAVQPRIEIVELFLPADLYFYFSLRKDWRPLLGMGLSYGYQVTTGTDYAAFYPRHQLGGRVSLGLEKVFRQFAVSPRLIYQQVLNEQLRPDNWLTTGNLEYLHVQRLQLTLAFYGARKPVTLPPVR